jgi:hypothetical protein
MTSYPVYNILPDNQLEDVHTGAIASGEIMRSINGYILWGCFFGKGCIQRR